MLALVNGHWPSASPRRGPLLLNEGTFKTLWEPVAQQRRLFCVRKITGFIKPGKYTGCQLQLSSGLRHLLSKSHDWESTLWRGESPAHPLASSDVGNVPPSSQHGVGGSVQGAEDRATPTLPGGKPHLGPPLLLARCACS